MFRQLLEYHPRIGHRFIPGLKARIEHEGGGYLVRTKVFQTSDPVLNSVRVKASWSRVRSFDDSEQDVRLSKLRFNNESKINGRSRRDDNGRHDSS